MTVRLAPYNPSESEGQIPLRTGQPSGRMDAMALRKVVMVLFEQVQTLDVAGPADALTWGTHFAPGDGDGYAITYASLDGTPVRSKSGLGLGVDCSLAEVDGPIDTLLIPGGGGMHLLDRPTPLVKEVQRLSSLARRTGGVCTGAFVLAEAGLLDGRSATTHWFACRTLAERYPAVAVQPDRIYVDDGTVATSGGITAGIDLALALVEADFDAATARKVARWLVMFLQRPGGQSQFSERLTLELASGSVLRPLVDAIVAQPDAAHSVADLAARAAISERHLTRVFASELGMTPGRFVERVRVEAARDLLEATQLKLPVIADRSGFGSVETMRRSFLRVTGVGPGEHRRRFGTPSGTTDQAA
jgi:transcriptional regulator GlxA family with amidase domain